MCHVPKKLLTSLKKLVQHIILFLPDIIRQYSIQLTGATQLN